MNGTSTAGGTVPLRPLAPLVKALESLIEVSMEALGVVQRGELDELPPLLARRGEVLTVVNRGLDEVRRLRGSFRSEELAEVRSIGARIQERDQALVEALGEARDAASAELRRMGRAAAARSAYSVRSAPGSEAGR